MSTELETPLADLVEAIPTRSFTAESLKDIGDRLEGVSPGFIADEPDAPESGAGTPPAEGAEEAKEWFEEPATPEEPGEDPETKAKFDALELNEPWRKQRLNQESQKRQAAEQRAAQLEAELQRFRAGAPVTPQVPTGAPQGQQATTPEQMEAWIVQNVPEARKAQMDLDAVKEENFATVGEFNRAYLAAQRTYDRTIDRVQVGMSQEMAQQQRQVETAQQTAERQASDYLAKVEKSTIPNFPKYLTAFRQVAPQLHNVILQAVTASDEPDIATAAIMSSKANFEYFQAASQNPAKIPAALARLGALTEAYKAQAKAKPTPAPAAAPKVSAAAPQVPRGDGGGNGIAYHRNLRAQIGAGAYMQGVIKGKYPDLSGILD